MSLRRFLRRLACPDCIHDDARTADRRVRTVSILERSGEALDRLTDELGHVRRRMADDRSPFMGERREGERR